MSKLSKKTEKSCLLIVDYNLSRFNDVKQMTDYAKARYGLETVLIRPHPVAADFEVATAVIDLDPRGPDFVKKAAEALAKLPFSLKAGCVFSDNAVYTGAQLLEHLGLVGDSAMLADAAYSKIIYREREKAHEALFKAERVYVPQFAVIHSAPELQAFAAAAPGGFVLKPACEGNNRGVLLLQKGADLEAALAEVARYGQEGLICEALIDYPYEFSYDGIGGLHFCTEKMSVHGRYPVECGQVVPARLAVAEAHLLERAGKLANRLVGQGIGPFHNEIKLNPATGEAAVIEPNRRPAGMRIWSLAEKVYGYNFYHLWIDAAMGALELHELPLPKGVAMIQMLGVPVDGVLQVPPALMLDPAPLIAKVLQQLPPVFKADGSAVEWFDFKWNKASTDLVYHIPKDNSFFVAQICAFVPDVAFDIIELLTVFEGAWQNVIREYIQENKS